MELSSEDDFLRDKHTKYFIRSLAVLPESCAYLDSNRIPVAFFGISGLDVIGNISKLDKEKQNMIDWLYSFFVFPESTDENSADCGFKGSITCSIDKKVDICDKPHIAATYSALCCLVILGDDLSRIDRKSVAASVRRLQLPSGCYLPIRAPSESDMRYLFCATSICYILQDWSGIDVDKAVKYIQSSLNYDGGIGQAPGVESHAGYTYCALASLSLMGKLEEALTSKQLKSLKRWLVFLQSKGFHGRPNKPDDTCYSFWAGASLKILNCYDYIDYSELLKYVLSAQNSVTGGFAKYPYEFSDLLHTFLSINGLSLKNELLETSVVPTLNISKRAADHLLKLHQEWESS